MIVDEFYTLEDETPGELERFDVFKKTGMIFEFNPDLIKPFFLDEAFIPILDDTRAAYHAGLVHLPFPETIFVVKDIFSTTGDDYSRNAEAIFFCRQENDGIIEVEMVSRPHDDKGVFHLTSLTIGFDRVDGVPQATQRICYRFHSDEAKRKYHARPDLIDQYTNTLHQWLMTCLSLLDIEQTVLDEVVVSPKLNKARAKRKKAPLRNYYVLKIKRVAHRHSGVTHNDRASPRFHVRRGHIRRLMSGRATRVKPTVVGDFSNGVRDKRYVVSA